MKIALRFVALLAVIVLLSGCALTAMTIDAAKEHVNYKVKRVEAGESTPLEIESVEKAKPGYYALVPFAVVADTVLLPVYGIGAIGVQFGIVPFP